MLHGFDRKVLICGPMFPAQGVGGLQSVLTDLAAGLGRRGWHVDTLPVPFVADWRGAGSWRSTLAAVSRRRVPDAWRFVARTLLHDVRELRQESGVLFDIQSRIADGRYSSVIACVDNAPVGLSSLVTRTAPNPVLLSLSALTYELRHRRMIDTVGRLARRSGVRGLHLDVLRPVHPARVSCAVFPSRSWRDAGIAAGLNPQAARAIYFGIQAPAKLPPARPTQSLLRLLWAARLGPEKGLHVFLPALARLRDAMPLRLTIIDAGGAETYRQSIRQTITRLKLDDVVQWQRAAPREDLASVLADHDLFLFYSVYAEPVAQMLLAAFAAGTVVVAPTPAVTSAIRPGETAVTFNDERPAAIAETIAQAARDQALRHRVRARAFALVGAEQSFDRTIAEYDRLLAAVTGERLQAMA